MTFRLGRLTVILRPSPGRSRHWWFYALAAALVLAALFD